MRLIWVIIRDFFFSLPLILSPFILLQTISPCPCRAEDKYDYHTIKNEYSPQPKEGFSGDPRSLTTPLTMTDAIRIALKNNPDLDVAIARIGQSDAMVDEAISAFWPVIGLYWEYLQGDAPSAYLFKTIDQRKLPPGVDFNNPGWFQNFEVGVRARINLFRGGRDWLRKRMAETGLEINELDRQSVENALVESVIKAYYNALLAEEHIKIAKESVSSVETQLRMMRVRYAGGGALKSDILSLEVRLAQAREDLVRARNNRSLAIAALANLLGLDPDSTLVLKPGEAPVTELPKDYRTGVPYALAHRPELRGARLRIIQARMDLDMARAEYLPRLDGEARYYMDDPDMTFETSRANWTAGIILNWDVFTGLSTKAKMKRKTNVLEEMLAVDRKATLAVQLDLKTAYLRLSEARARVAVTDASVAQAEESLRLVKKEYEGGSVTITRYLETELARNRARMRASVAFYDKEKAAAALGRALGLWGKYAEEVMAGDE